MIYKNSTSLYLELKIVYMNIFVQTTLIICFMQLYVKYNGLKIVKLINLNQVSTTKTHLSVHGGQNLFSCFYYNTNDV